MEWMVARSLPALLQVKCAHCTASGAERLDHLHEVPAARDLVAPRAVELRYQSLERIGTLDGLCTSQVVEFVKGVVHGRVHRAPAAPRAPRLESLERIRQVLVLVPAIEVVLYGGIHHLGTHHEICGHLRLLPRSRSSSGIHSAVSQVGLPAGHDTAVNGP